MSAETFLQVIGGLDRIINDDDGLSIKTDKATSLIEYARPTRIEPIVMVDERLVNLPYMVDIMHNTNSIFAGYYLQAASLSMKVGRIDVRKMLDRLNPSRDPVANIAFESHTLSIESYKTQLPRWNSPVGMENYGVVAMEESVANVRELHENSNLSVGKMLQIEIGDGRQNAVINVNVRLIANTVSGSFLADAISITGKDTSWHNRYHQWRAGQLEFIRDLVLCQDLIDDHKKLLGKDRVGSFSEIMKRRRNNGLSALFSKSTSLATASNIIVISDTTRKEIESRDGLKFSSVRARKEIFEKTYLMLVVIVDPEREAVTIYHRGIDTPTELTVRQIKSGNKGTGPDISDILKAYQMGNSPTL
jgi:hypothetical protein